MTLDFTRGLDYVWALLPEIVLSVWGMAVLLAGVTGGRDRERPEGPPTELGWLALGGILLAALANGWLYALTDPGTGMVAVDGFRLFANWIFLLAAALTVLISFGYVVRQRLQIGEFYALILFSTVGMMLMASARDLILIFLGLEVMSIAVYALTAFNRRDRRSAEAGLKYFVLGAFSTGFFLYGIALVYGATGSTDIQTVATAVASGAAPEALLLFGVAFLLVGFGFKVAVVPFHMWTPDVYEGAPAPITAFMSTAVKAAGFVAFLRVFSVAFAGVYETWFPIAWWIAALTMVAANLTALVQTNVKRMLAYSSIAHAGYLLVAVVALNELAAAGLLFYLLVYTLMNVGAFAVVITVANQGEERLQIEDYAGLGWSQPLLGILFTIFLLSLAGFPGTGGFMGKIFLLQGAVSAQLTVLAVILVLTTLVSYWYYLRVAWYMWMREPAGAGEEAPLYQALPMRVALLAAAGLILWTGILPGGTLEAARAGVAGLGAFVGGMAGP